MKSNDKEQLPITEQQNPDTLELSSLRTPEVLRLMNREDSVVADVIKGALPDVALAVEGIVERLERGGRLFYTGTGTSGRLGVLDATECPPTFGTSPDLVQAIIAGGYEAVYRAVEASEDDRAAGARDLEERGITSSDAVVGITASGRTPYTIGAVEHARSRGAFSVAVTCNSDSPIGRIVDASIVAVVGPEVLTGSTRLKAGTAQKMILNMISTATMIRLGYVSGNRMSNLKAGNIKLRTRALRTLMEECDVDEETAEEILEAAGGDLAIAFVMRKSECTLARAQDALKTSKGVIQQAIKTLTK